MVVCLDSLSSLIICFLLFCFSFVHSISVCCAFMSIVLINCAAVDMSAQVTFGLCTEQYPEWCPRVRKNSWFPNSYKTLL